MKIAIIYPTHLVGLFSNLTKFHLVVPKQITEDNIPIIRNLTAKNHHVILDNGVYEGETLNISELHQVSDKLGGVNEIVLPDVFQDAEATLDNYTELYHNQERINSRRNYMLVPQGKDVTDWLINLQEITKIWPPKSDPWTIGIPKWLGKDDPKLRTKLVQYLEDNGSFQRVHLLGCNGMRELNEIIKAQRSGRTNIRSMDTSYPVKIALEGYALIEDVDLKATWDSNSYLEQKPNADRIQLIAYNVMYFLNKVFDNESL